MKQIIAHQIKNFALCLALVCAGGMAWADSPHYLRLNTSINADLCYAVDLKEAGLGTANSITYNLSADACIAVACVNKKGHVVQGVPKSGESSGTQPTTLPVRSGQTTGTILLCPSNFNLPDPGCTGSQELTTLAVQYTHVILSDGLSDTALPPGGMGQCPQ
jgi:hypothetical protein